MLRPASIVRFERCYLGAFALGIIGLLLTGPARLAAAQAALAAQGRALPTGGANIPLVTLVVGVVVGGAITLVLWWFTARQGSVVAKWIVVVFYVIGLVGVLISLTNGTFVGGVGGVLTVAQWVLQTIAVVMLFRPDAAAWFAARRAAA